MSGQLGGFTSLANTDREQKYSPKSSPFNHGLYPLLFLKNSGF